MDNFLNIRQLVPQLIKFKEDFPDKKIAFCFSGGGARGAYFGGVIEAIQQEVNKQPQQSLLPLEERWKPDIICGSSAGALAGFAYWMEALLPGGSQAPYACRQSKIWRDISDGNKGAEKLFSNPLVIDFLSNSSFELDAFLDSLEVTQQTIKLVSDDIDKWWTDTKLVISEAGSFDVDRLRDNISGRINDIRNRASGLLKVPKVSQLGSYAGDACNLLKDTHNLIPNLIADIAGMQIDKARNLISHIQDLNKDIQKGNKDIGKAIRDIRDSLNKFQNLFKTIIITLRQTLRSIKERSSLMNNEGLQAVLENYIYNSFPAGKFPMVNGKIEARDLDNAIIDLIKNNTNPKKKIPDLFITGTNINAKRCVAFSLATADVNNKVASRNLWVIKLDDKGTDMAEHKMKTLSTPVAPNEFVFGGKRFDEDYSHSADIKFSGNTPDPRFPSQVTTARRNSTWNKINIVSPPIINTLEKNDPGTAVVLSGTTKVTGKTNQASVASAGTVAINFMNPESDFTKGKSLFVGAVLTSATIPVALPPRQWTFFSSSVPQVKFKHWMVDGGVVDNRPIDVAEKAGAEIIISFELTPLLSVTRELKKEVTEYPKFIEVISRSMMDATLNAGFYRYFEDLVTENAHIISPATKPRLTIYRMAPMMYNTPEDVDYGNGIDWDEYTPGTYDFNGKYDKQRNFRMGLFDWFMKGFVDARGGDAIDKTDPVHNAYISLPDSFGAKKNAYLGRRSGFYDASVKAHPDTNPPW